MAMGPQTLLFILRVQDQASQALQGAGLAVASLGFAMGAATIAAVQAEVAFNRTFTQMQTLASVTAAEVGQVSQAVKDMAIATGQGPQQLAEALYFASSSGFETAEAMEVVDASARGAAIGLGTTEVVADALTSALNAYGHSSMTAAEATGIMAVAVQDGKVEATQLAAALGNVIPIASQVGVSFRDVNAAVSAMSLSGLTASEGVTAVRQTLLAISAPTQQARKVLKAMGSDYKEVQQIFREEGYLVGIQKLRELLGNSDVNLRMVLGDVQAVNGNASLLGANLARTKQIFDDVGNAGADSLRKMFEIAASSDAFKWDQGVALLKVALLDLGDMVMPVVISAINAALGAYDALKGSISAVTGFFNEHRMAITGVAIAIGSLMIINMLPGLLIGMAAALATATLRMQALTLAIRAFSMGSISGAISSIVTGVVLLAQAAVAAIPAIGSMAAALWATGIPEIVIAITAIVGALVWFSNTMFETSQGVASGWEIIQASWAALSAFTASIWGEISGYVETAGRVILAVLTLGLSEAVIAVYQNWNSIWETTQAIWGVISPYVLGVVRAIAAGLTLGLSELVIAVYNNWDSIYKSTVEIWNNIKDYVIGTIRVMAAIATVGLSELAIAGYNAMKPAAARAGTAAGAAYNQSLQAAIAARTAVVNTPVVPKPVKPVAAPPPRPVAGPDYEPPKHTRAPAAPKKTEAEKEAEKIQRVVEALTVQAEKYSQSAEQVEYLDNVRRAGLNTMTLEQVHLQDGLNITDAQAAASTRLNGVREIARAVQAKYTAEMAEQNRELHVSMDAYDQIADLQTEEARTRAILTAGINAETEARKRNASAADIQIARRDAEWEAARKFDADERKAATSRTQTYQDDIAGLTAQSMAMRMRNRDAAVYLAGEQARIKAQRDGATDAAAQIARAQQIAGLQYDLQNRSMNMQDGINKYLDELSENAISTGQIVYDSLSTAVNGLSGAIGDALTGQSVAWGKLASDVAGSIAKMIAQMLFMKAVAASMKFLGFAMGGTPGVNSSGIASADELYAMGGAFQPFAKGGDFTNSIVDQATMFAFNDNGHKKMGVMGEAGPEAIMPLIQQGNAMAVAAWAADGTRKALALTRGPDGKLGVQMPEPFADGGMFSALKAMPKRGAAGPAHGGSGTQYIEGDTHISAPVSVTYQGTGDQQLDDRNIEVLRKVMESTVDDRIGKALEKVGRNGGRMNLFGVN